MTTLSSVKLHKRYHLIFFGINLQDNPLKYFNATLSNISKDSSMHTSGGDGGDINWNVLIPLTLCSLCSLHFWSHQDLFVSLWYPGPGQAQLMMQRSLSLSLSPAFIQTELN